MTNPLLQAISDTQTAIRAWQAANIDDNAAEYLCQTAIALCDAALEASKPPPPKPTSPATPPPPNLSAPAFLYVINSN